MSAIRDNTIEICHLNATIAINLSLLKVNMHDIRESFSLLFDYICLFFIFLYQHLTAYCMQIDGIYKNNDQEIK